MTNLNNQYSKIWNRICKRLKTELGEDVYSSWFARAEFEGLDNCRLSVSVPTKFLQTWLTSHYQDKVTKIASDEFSKAGVSEVEDVGFCQRRPQPVAQVSQINQAQENNLRNAALRAGGNMQVVGGVGGGNLDSITQYGGFIGSPLDKRFRFDKFITGSANRLAHAAALQVADMVGETVRFNPLYIHSNVGLGKTHLLHAIAWHVRERNPQARVLYLTAERFMYSFIEALKKKDAIAFKDKLRGIDVLLIDDMEFLQGRATQQEFGHTLNSLIDSNKQVVVASDRAPTQLESLDARMRSRLSGGLVAEVGSLEHDLRRKILEQRIEDKKKADEKFMVHEEVIDFLAKNLTESGRELEGAVTRIFANSQFTNEPITLTAVEHIVRDLMCSKEPRRIKIEDILRVISRHYGVPRSDILSERRNRSIVLPRQVGMYLAKRMTSRSLPEIGRRFGGRDHTTVLHAIRKIEKELGGDNNLKEELDILERLLKD